MLVPEWQAEFRQDLTAKRFMQTENSAAGERWDGEVVVRWIDPASGLRQKQRHRVAIRLSSGFPFRKPEVYPTDDSPPIRDNRHQAPGEAGALCLYREDAFGWLPATTLDELLDRIRAWFGHYHRDDWPPEDQAPDLHLYFPIKATRPLMLIGDDWVPPKEEQSGRFGVWGNGPERAFAGAPVTDVGLPPLIHRDRVLPQLSLYNQRRSQIGVWLRLPREPRPSAHLGPLLAEVDAAVGRVGWAKGKLHSLYGDKMRGKCRTALLALGYPDDSGGEQWLFLSAELSQAPGGRRWTRAAALEQIGLESFETASVSRAALMRRTGHTAQALENTQVVVFGQGAIGSRVAMLLALAGVPKLQTVESDRMRPGNAVRNVAGIPSTGAPKAMAVAVEISRHVPDCRLVSHEETWDPNLLGGYVRKGNVIVDATANPAFSLLLNEVCLQEDRPMIYAAAYRRAALGRILVVRPGVDACYVCYEGGGAAIMSDADYPLIPAGEEGAFMEPGCGIPTVEASAVDVEQVANWAARAVLHLLLGKQGDKNHCLIVNDLIPEAHGDLADLGVHWSRWAPLAACEACCRYQRKEEADA